MDGQYLTSAPVALAGSSGDSGNVKLDFGTAGTRRIAVEVTYGRFYGKFVQTLDTQIAAPGPTPKRILWLGDSYTGGAKRGHRVVNLRPHRRVAARVPRQPQLRHRRHRPPGARSSSVKFRDRVTNDVVNQAPQVVTVAGGHNDTSFTNAAIQTEAAALFAAIKSGFPSATIVALGPLFAGGNPGIYPATQSAIFAATSTGGILTVDTCAAPWFTGTGHVGATAGDGNSDKYIRSDGVHPMQLGADYLGHRVAAALPTLGITAA